MTGTKAGAIKTRATNYKRYGKDYYRNLGKLGGKVKGILKGFALNPELARKAGKKGGTISRRTGVKNGEGKPRLKSDK